MNVNQISNNRFSIYILGVLILAGNLFAQPPQRGRMQGPPPLPDSCRIVEMVDELSKSISLDDEQKNRILQLHFAHFSEAKEMMEKQKSKYEKHRQEMESLRKEFEGKVKELLTEEQTEKFDEFQKNRPKPHGEFRQKRK